MVFRKIAAVAFLATAIAWAPATVVSAQQGVKMLAPGVYVAPAMTPGDVKALKQAGATAIVDLLPDDEAAPQARSTDMAAAAGDAGVTFAYAPTRSAALAPEAVEQTAKALASGKRPIVLYCRSGSRASRVWALSEASRPDGMDAAGILRAVASAGYSADDLRGEIDRRIGARAK